MCFYPRFLFFFNSRAKTLQNWRKISSSGEKCKEKFMSQLNGRFKSNFFFTKFVFGKVVKLFVRFKRNWNSFDVVFATIYNVEPNTWESVRQIAVSAISGAIAFISSSRIRCSTARCGSGDIYVTVKGVKRSGKVSRATIGRRLPWFRHPPINAPKQLSPNPDRTDLLHYLHKCNRRARVRCRECKRAGKKRCLLRVACADCHLGVAEESNVWSFRCARFRIVARKMSLESRITISATDPSMRLRSIFLRERKLEIIIIIVRQIITIVYVTF